MSTKLSEAEEVARCEKFRDEALSSDSGVRFLFKALARGGCVTNESNIECCRCDGKLAGGFKDDGSIKLCSNHLLTQQHTNATLIHESIHAFDQCRAQIDWSNCVHHACSEIRAAALSGDCSFGREVMLRGNIGFGKQFQKCIRRRAEISVAMNPNCDALTAKRAVDKAWEACYNDTEPFDKIP